MADTTILRVAISQCILFTILCYVFILLGCTLDENGTQQYNIARNGLFVMSGYFVIPLVFALILLKKLVLVRVWITATLFNAVILLCLLMSGAIRLSWNLDIFWTIILIAIPILLTMWIFDHIILVVDCYRKLEYQEKQESIKARMIAGISFV
ncbi:hypothetical protein RN001_002962 [Aquatica leii]|uniref:Uncharacterized protein n=1 Tax=Aquatica leii TaxID=1421715 RepID=A0AAN7PN17_9COLE|nr:hypothetical protein RN001_002962 [Aquatica leii]